LNNIQKGVRPSITPLDRQGEYAIGTTILWIWGTPFDLQYGLVAHNQILVRRGVEFGADWFYKGATSYHEYLTTALCRL